MKRKKKGSSTGEWGAEVVIFEERSQMMVLGSKGF
jgi:hypothetical protein